MVDDHDLFVEKLTYARQNIQESLKQAGDFFKDKVQKLKNPLKVFFQSATPTVGNMYMFSYDPKYKNVLPYYDAHPLVFPIEFYSNGFLGINLHYLPPMARASLMSNLKKLSSDNKYNDRVDRKKLDRIDDKVIKRKIKTYPLQYLIH